MCGLVREAMAEGRSAWRPRYLLAGHLLDHRELSRSPRRRPSSAGRIASHIRGEGAALLGSIMELIEIAGRSGARRDLPPQGDRTAELAEVGRAIEIVEAARAEVCPSRPTCTRTTTRARGSTSCIPPWAHEGGFDALVERLRDPDVRARVVEDLGSVDGGRTRSGRRAQRIVVAGFRRGRAPRPDRQDARGGGVDPRDDAGGGGDGPPDRGRQQRQRALLRDVRGRRAHGPRGLAGELLLRRGVAGAEGIF